MQYTGWPPGQLDRATVLVYNRRFAQNTRAEGSGRVSQGSNHFRVDMFKKTVFIAAVALVPFAAAAQGNAEAAKAKISTCVGCHGIPGYKTAFPVVYSVPKIAGQSAKYIENALIAYRKGDRTHPSMRGIAGSLSDQDIADIAAYYGTK